MRRQAEYLLGDWIYQQRKAQGLTAETHAQPSDEAEAERTAVSLGLRVGGTHLIKHQILCTLPDRSRVWSQLIAAGVVRKIDADEQGGYVSILAPSSDLAFRVYLKDVLTVRRGHLNAYGRVVEDRPLTPEENAELEAEALQIVAQERQQQQEGDDATEAYRGFTLRTAQIRKVVVYDAEGHWQGEWDTEDQAKLVIDQWAAGQPLPQPERPKQEDPAPIEAQPPAADAFRAALQSELLTVLHSQLSVTYDVALKLRGLTRQADPFQILATIDSVYRDLKLAVQVINEIRP